MCGVLPRLTIVFPACLFAPLPIARYGILWIALCPAHWLVTPQCSSTQTQSSLPVYTGRERVLQQKTLLLAWCSCRLQALTHLVEGGCIDLTPRIPLAEYV